MTGFLAVGPYVPPRFSGDDGGAKSFRPVMTGCKVGSGKADVALAAEGVTHSAAETLKFDSESEYAQSEPRRSD